MIEVYFNHTLQKKYNRSIFIKIYFSYSAVVKYKRSILFLGSIIAVKKGKKSKILFWKSIKEVHTYDVIFGSIIAVYYTRETTTSH